MRIITIILPLLLIAGCDGHYRYPCQDPANWGKLECNNDVCKAEGTCTSDVLAPAGSREFSNNTQTETESSEELSTEDSETEISSSGCVEPKKLSYKSDDEDRTFNVKNKMIAPEEESGNNAIDREVITVIDSAADTEEKPLTMNTVVDTAAHNAATK